MISQTISFSFLFDHVKLHQRQHWNFLVGLAVIAAFNYQGEVKLLNIGGLSLVTSGIVYLFSLQYRRVEKSSASLEIRTHRLKQIATWQALSDLLLITAAIHVTGGASSPVPLMYIILIGAISTFFPPRELMSLNLVAVLLYACLMQSYALRLITPAASILPIDVIVPKTLPAKWPADHGPLPQNSRGLAGG
jgi:hypothetical protein